MSDDRAVTCQDHNRRRRPAEYRSPHKGNVFEFASLGGGPAARGNLLHGHGFAGQCGLVHEQVFGGQQPDVGRYQIACSQMDNVAGDKFGDRPLLCEGGGVSFRAAPHCYRGVDHGAVAARFCQVASETLRTIIPPIMVAAP